MNTLKLGYAYFGKKDGFELFEVGGLLEEINNSHLREEFQTALQLKLEEIRIFEGSKVYRLSQFETSNGPINLFTVFSYALDDYQRDGFRATCLAIDGSAIDPQKIWDFIHLYPSEIKEANELLARLFAFAQKEKIVQSYQENRAFIPLYSNESAEVYQLIDAWLLGQLSSYATLYVSSDARVMHSIRSKGIRVFGENPFWEGKQEVSESVEVKDKENKQERKRFRSDKAPADSLVHAFESDQGSRWDKKAVPVKEKSSQKKNKIWAWVALGFVGLLSGLIWIAL